MKDMKGKIWYCWKWSRNCNRNRAGSYQVSGETKTRRRRSTRAWK